MQENNSKNVITSFKTVIMHSCHPNYLRCRERKIVAEDRGKVSKSLSQSQAESKRTAPWLKSSFPEFNPQY
jgi:hypothetical protein